MKKACLRERRGRSQGRRGTFTREEMHVRERMFMREEETFAREDGHVREGRQNIRKGRGDVHER